MSQTGTISPTTFSSFPPTVSAAGNFATPTPSGVSTGSGYGSFRTDASTELLWREQSVNAAAYLAAIAWGLYLAVFYRAVANILKNKNRTNLTWLPFLVATFITATISMCCFANYNEQAWIDQRNYPNGPLYYLNQQLHTPVYVAAIAASMLTQFFCQGFLAYRCHILWNKIWISIPLALWVMADFALAVGYCAVLAKSDAQFSLIAPASVPLASSWVIVAMTYNIIVTAILLWRLIYLAAKFPPTFPEDIKRKFVRVDVILVESVLFLGFMSLVYVSLFGEGNTGANLFFPFIVQLEAIFPSLIIIRMVQEHGWEANTIFKTLSDLHNTRVQGVDIESNDKPGSQVPPPAYGA